MWTASGVDLAALAAEFEQLLRKMRDGLLTAHPDKEDRDMAAVRIAAAKLAAEEGDGVGVMVSLKWARAWELRLAEKFNIRLAVLAIKSATGMR